MPRYRIALHTGVGRSPWRGGKNGAVGLKREGEPWKRGNRIIVDGPCVLEDVTEEVTQTHIRHYDFKTHRDKMVKLDEPRKRKERRHYLTTDAEVTLE